MIGSKRRLNVIAYCYQYIADKPLLVQAHNDIAVFKLLVQYCIKMFFI